MDTIIGTLSFWEGPEFEGAGELGGVASSLLVVDRSCSTSPAPPAPIRQLERVLWTQVFAHVHQTTMNTATITNHHQITCATCSILALSEPTFYDTAGVIKENVKVKLCSKSWQWRHRGCKPSVEGARGGGSRRTKG